MTALHVRSLRALVFATVLFAAATAHAELLRYPVKYICNEFSSANLSGAVAISGAYRTAINIHNPNAEVVFGLSYSRSTLTAGGGPPKTATQSLPAGQSMVIDCTTIANVLFGTNIGQFPDFAYEGFVDILSVKTLDVTAVYSAGPSEGPVSTLHVNVIEPRKQELKISASGGPPRD